MIIAAAEMYCKPELQIEHKVWQEDMKLVLDIWVNKSKHRPVMAFNEEGVLRAYVRVDDSTLMANKILLGVWKREGFKNDRPQQFGETEIALLKCFSLDEGLTLSKIYKLSELKKKQVDDLMIRFVAWGLVRMELSETETMYYIEMSEI